MNKHKVDGSWMVISRHYMMPGCLFNNGVADIDEFFENEEDAYKYARERLKSMVNSDYVDPHVWVLRCERTYIKSKEGLGYVYSEYK